MMSATIEKVRILAFRHIDTSGLLRTLPPAPKFTPSLSRAVPDIKPKPVIKSTIETFSIPFKDVLFKNGGVSLTRKFNQITQPVSLFIENIEIREEFDAIKNYFSNILETKKIQVTATLEVTNGEITSVAAKSAEIERINNALIESVKFELLKAAKRDATSELSGNLLDLDELLSRLAKDNFDATIFYGNEEQLFADLLKISNSKHYNHLRFLSSKHCHQILKLRFISKPFSFVFLLEGFENYYVVWETLDTQEATYVWHTSKNRELLTTALTKIENTISAVRAQGKTAYLNTKDESFYRICHDYSEVNTGFVIWKTDLEAILR